MPYVGADERPSGALFDLERLADDLGPPPWRSVLVGTDLMRVVLLHWPPGHSTEPHRHPRADETFLVLRGRAVFTIGDAPEVTVGPGAFLIARQGVRHTIRVPLDDPLTLLASVSPNEDLPDETIE
jgi:quercetin dioxygenase-like cupin family protein